MVIYSIWSDKDGNLFWKISETTLQLGLHALVACIHIFSVFVLLVLISWIPMIQFGDHVFGNSFSDSLDYVSYNKNVTFWDFCKHLNWFYKLSILGGTFALDHLITNNGD